MNIVDRIGKKQMEKALAQRAMPEFGAGDTLRVDVKVVEGSRERIQAFEGVCIARKNDGVNSSFTVASCPTARASSGFSRFTVRRLPASPWCAVAVSAGQSYTICVAGPARPPALPKKQQTARRLPPDGCDRQGRSPRRQP